MAAQSEPTPLDFNWYSGETQDILLRGFNLIADKYFGYIWTLDSDTLSDVGQVFHLRNAAFQKWIKEEAILGETDEMYNIGNSYYALIYAYLIARSVLEYGYTLEQAKLKYNYAEVKKCFACKGINLDDYLAIFELGKPANCGIEHIAIEYTFQIENAVDCGAVVQKYIPKGEEGFLKNLNLDTCNWFIPTDCRCLTTFKPSPKFPNWGGSSSSGNACDCKIVNYFNPSATPSNYIYSDGVDLFAKLTTLPPAETNFTTYSAFAQVRYISDMGVVTSLGYILEGQDIMLAPFKKGTYAMMVVYVNNLTDLIVYGVATMFVELAEDGAEIKSASFGGELGTSPCIEEIVSLEQNLNGTNIDEISYLNVCGGIGAPFAFGDGFTPTTLDSSPSQISSFTLNTSVNTFYNILAYANANFNWTALDNSNGDFKHLLAVNLVTTNCALGSGSECPCDIVSYNFLEKLKASFSFDGMTITVSSNKLDDAVGKFSRPLSVATDNAKLIIYSTDGVSIFTEFAVDITNAGAMSIPVPYVGGRTYIAVVEVAMIPEGIKSRIIANALDVSDGKRVFRAGNKFNDMTDTYCLTCYYSNITEIGGREFNFTEQGFLEDMINLGAPIVVDNTSPVQIFQQLPSTTSNYFLAGTLYEIAGWDNLNFFFSNPATPQDSPIFGELRTDCKITKVEKQPTEKGK